MSDLTDRAIRAAASGDVLHDTSVRGLHVRCFPESRAFYLFYRTKAGQQRRPKLGDQGSITLAQARQAAREVLAEVAAGRDPGAERQAARGEATVAELWAEYWRRHGSKKKSGDEDLRMWESYLQPRLGSKKLSAVSYTEMADLHAGMAATPAQANRTLALASKMFNFARRPLEWCEKNPCQGVGRYKERKRRRKASRDEIASIVAALRRELDGPNQASAAFLWLLLTTGARKGEIAAAKWEEIEGNRLLLDVHKTDEGGFSRIIYLPPVALEVLALLPRGNATLTGVSDPKKLWARIRKQAGCPDLTQHDLRRTFASVALSTGQVSLEQVMQMLGHTSAQTTKVYAWLMEDAATAAVGVVADRLMLPVSQKETPA